MMILSIDPGPEKSAWVELTNGVTVGRFGHDVNSDMLATLRAGRGGDYILVIEKVESQGMAVGSEVFETVYWSGRFAEAWGGEVVRIGRREVKLSICGNPRAKDANIRQALIDRWGGSAAIKKGGALYKVSNHVWAALAVAVTYYDKAAGFPRTQDGMP